MKKTMPFAIYRILAALLAVCVFVLAISLISTLEDRYYLKLDVSDSGVSELSPYTTEKLEELSSDVSVYTVWSANNTSFLKDLQTELLKRMCSVCSRISFHQVIPEQEPLLLTTLNGNAENIPDGTCFVRDTNGTRIVRLEAEDFLFSRKIDEEQYTIFCGEARLIGAITAISLERPVHAVFSTGHGEADMTSCARLTLQLQAMGAMVGNGSIHMMDLTADDLLVIADPQADLTAEETDTLISFLEQGGKLIVAVGMNTRPDHLKNLCAVLDLYGLGIRAGRVTEMPESTGYYIQEPGMLSPVPEEEPELQIRLSGRLILPGACALATPAHRPGVTHRTLLETSTSAVLHSNTGSDTAGVVPGDETGEMKLAILSETTADARILTLSSAIMLRDDMETDVGFDLQDASENLNFLAGVIRYMIHRDVTWTLDAGVRQLPDRLIVFENEQTRHTAGILLLTVIPGIILTVMAVVLIRRRKRT